MPEEFALEKPGWNRGTVEFYEGARFAGTQIVNRARDQLLPGASLSVNQNGGIGGRDRLDLLQDPAQRLAPADDLLEFQLASDFVFEIQLLLSQLILQVRDFAKDPCIFDGNRDLAGDLREKREFVRAE